MTGSAAFGSFALVLPPVVWRGVGVGMRAWLEGVSRARGSKPVSYMRRCTARYGEVSMWCAARTAVRYARGISRRNVACVCVGRARAVARVRARPAARALRACVIPEGV